MARKNYKNSGSSPNRIASRFLFGLGAVLTFWSCTIITTRPVQEMSDTVAAIRAAREVQADTLAPELYRQSNEWFFKARNEYKFKNFSLALEYAEKARAFAEQAEFESIRNGGNRSDSAAADPLTGAPPPPSEDQKEAKKESYDYPKPEGTPSDVFDERKAAEDSAKKKAAEDADRDANPTPAPQPSAGGNFFPPTQRK